MAWSQQMQGKITLYVHEFLEYRSMTSGLLGIQRLSRQPCTFESNCELDIIGDNFHWIQIIDIEIKIQFTHIKSRKL